MKNAGLGKKTAIQWSSVPTDKWIQRVDSDTLSVILVVLYVDIYLVVIPITCDVFFLGWISSCKVLLMQGDLRSDLTSDPGHTEHADTDVSSSCLLSQGQWPLCDFPRPTKCVYDEAVNLLKAQCHEIKMFLKAKKIKAELFERVLMVFTIFGCLFMKKIQYKSLHASMKSLINCESPYSNPL